MATSGTVTFNPDIDEIISEAFGHIGKEVLTAEDIVSARTSLNYLFIEMSNASVPLSKIEKVTITLTEDVSEYNLDQDVYAVFDFVSNRDGNDVPLHRKSFQDFNEISQKDQKANRITTFTVIKTLDRLKIKVWPTPSGTGETIIGYVAKRVQDASRPTQTVDFRPEYLPALRAGLAYKLALKKEGISQYKLSVLKMEYQELFDLASKQDTERASFYVTPRIPRGY